LRGILTTEFTQQARENTPKLVKKNTFKKYTGKHKLKPKRMDFSLFIGTAHLSDNNCAQCQVRC